MDSKSSPTLQLINVLVVDDNPGVAALVQEAISAAPAVNVQVSHDALEAEKMLYDVSPDIVILDLIMPGLTGMELLDKIIQWNPATSVVLLTGEYRVDYAVAALQKGACDYLTKPFEVEALQLRINTLIDEIRLHKSGASTPRNESESDAPEEWMIGGSPAMVAVFDRMRQIAPHFRSVLIHAETGTGKELAARALHRLSPVSKGPFVVCNCAAIVETLFESQLFGHMKGAFTGAQKDHAGLFEEAEGGTLFLDEIGELPLSLQGKLLRALQERAIQRVGSHVVRHVNVRIIAATNRDLAAMVASNQFREDLYYRLAMVKIQLPRLADRRGDLPLLERHFIQKYSEQFGKNVTGCTRRVKILLERHTWPGNVRELENAIAHACMVATSEKLDVHDFPEELRNETGRPASTGRHLSPTIAEMEYKQALLTLQQCDGNKQEAAQRLGISRNTLYRILKDRPMTRTATA